MNNTLIGLAIGVLLAIVIVWGGWKLFLTALILGAIGAAVGAHFDGRINLVEAWNNLIGNNKGLG